MKDILLIAHFCSDFDGKGNNRFNYIADLLAENNLRVELVTSDFSHAKKEKRLAVNNNYKYKVTFVSEPVYKKNVSLKRFYSHYIMGKNLKKYLSKRKKPNIIYCAVPSLDVAYVAANYARKNNIKFIIDIQDLWPEAFKMVFNPPVIGNMIYSPMYKKADYIYGAADEIIAVSQTYMERALKVNKKCKTGKSIFIGTELSVFDGYAQKNKVAKPDNEIWLAYIGTLGHSYDLTCVIDALTILKEKDVQSLKFIIMGDGPLEEQFKKYAQEKDIYCEFTGRLDYSSMVGLLISCDIAVNPIARGAAQSIINKHADYSVAGLPLLNTQECLEYRKLIDDHQAGFNCENNNAESLAEKLLILYKDKNLRLEMGRNHRKLAEEKFDRTHSYNAIVEILEKYK